MNKEIAELIVNVVKESGFIASHVPDDQFDKLSEELDENGILKVGKSKVGELTRMSTTVSEKYQEIYKEAVAMIYNIPETG